MDTPKRFSRQDVEIFSCDPLYEGFFRANRYRFRHRLFAGGWSEVMEREVFERGHAVVALPYDPVRDWVVLQEQFRIGAVETSDSPWLIELVAGIVEEGESPEEVAHREAEEEAGLSLGRLEYAFSYLASPGGTTERLQIYVAEVDASHAGGLHGLPHEGEDIRVQAVPREQAWQWLQEGRIDNASTIIALQWLQLNVERLQRQWRHD